MMRLFSSLMLAVILSGLFAAGAQAQDGELLYEYTPPGWGFAVGLADYGAVYEPGDPEWDAPELDWVWISDVDDLAAAPIYRIDGQTIPLTDEAGNPVVLSAEDFSGPYFDSMVEQWSGSDTFTLLDSDPNYEGADGRVWHMFDLEEQLADGGVQYFYGMLGQDDDGTLRMISFFYEPTDDLEMQEAIAGMVMLHLDPSLLDEE